MTASETTRNGFEVIVTPGLQGSSALIFGESVFVADHGDARLNLAAAERAVALAGLDGALVVSR